MPCSRMPKCSVRPYQSPGNALVACSGGMNDGSPSIVVLLLSARSAEPPHSSGSTGAERLQHVAGRLAGGHALRVGLELGQRVGPAGRAARACDIRSNSAAPLRVRRPPTRRSRVCHCGVLGPAALDDLAGVREHVVGDLERLVRVEAEDLLGRGDLVGAERRAVGLAGVLLGRRGPADDRAQRDERRPVGHRLGRLDRLRRAPATSSWYAVGAAPVDVLDVPAVRLVPGRRCPRTWRCSCRPRSRSGCRPRSAVRLPSFWCAGEGGRLVADALLHVAVGGDHVDRVVERARARRRRPGRTGRARGGPPSPCRPRCRRPGRAGRWWSRRRRCGRAPGGPG